MDYLFNIGDKVRIKYYMDKTINSENNIIYDITNRTLMNMSDKTRVNVYILEALKGAIIKELYIDEIYLTYDSNYLRELKLKRIISNQS